MHMCVCLHIAYACIRQETALLLSGTTGQTKQAAEQITFCVFPIISVSLPLSMHVCDPWLCSKAQYMCVC